MASDLLRLKLFRNELRDLDFRDIQDDLSSANILTRSECQEVMLESNEDLRLDLIFILFEYKEQCGVSNIVGRFMEVLRVDYEWLYELWKPDLKGIKHSEFTKYQSHRNDSYIAILDDLIVYRRDVRWMIHKYLMMLTHGINSQARYLFVLGGFGSGKSTMVKKTCADYSIVKKMNHNIFSLDLANCNTKEKTLELLENLSFQFPRDHKPDDKKPKVCYPANEIFIRKRQLLALFKDYYPESLLVLSHVRDASLIDDFDFKCKTLVITSNSEVRDRVKENERYTVKLPTGFTEDESLELFAKALKTKPVHLPPQATEIHKRCLGNPFLIKLIAHEVSEEDGVDVDMKWNNQVENLSNYRIGPMEHSNTMIAIVNQLSEDEQACFRSFVVFRDNVKFSLKVLQLYWQKPPDVVKAIVKKLESKGLLEKLMCKNESFYKLHYVCFSYLLNAQGTNPANLHQRLVDNYRIPEKMQARRELDLLNEFPKDDYYFHFYIAYHLEKAGRDELFPVLFKDFGFLEQKLRFTGLPNTVGDLRLYKDKIFHNDLTIIEVLIDFLIEAEVLLSKSDDTCLLQLALNHPDPSITYMAEQQIERYQNRVWFRDVPHSHQYSMVKLCERPEKVRFQGTDYAFVSLSNYQILLVDLSSDYTTPFTIFSGCKSDIVDMQIVNHFLIALDAGGTIRIWCTNNTPGNRDARPLEGDSSNMRTKSQTLVVNNAIDYFTCFCLVPNKRPTELLAMTATGRLHVYRAVNTIFNQEFALKTHIKQSYVVLPLLDAENKMRKALFLTKEKDIVYIFNMISTSVDQRFVEPEAINAHQIADGLIFVSKSQIRLRRRITDGNDRLSYSANFVVLHTHINSVNTCSALTSDHKFVVAGTMQGISVISIAEAAEVRRTNISHWIMDVDVVSSQLPLDDSFELDVVDDYSCHHILISTSRDNENTINMCQLSVASSNQLINSQYQLPGINAFLANLDNDPVLLHTIDRNNKLQENKLNETSYHGYAHFGTPLGSLLLDSEVCWLIESAIGYVFGLLNGKVMLLESWNDDSDRIEPKEIMQLDGAITLLKYFQIGTAQDRQQDVIVAGSRDCCKVHVVGLKGHEINHQVRQCYVLFNNLILLIQNDCTFRVYDTEQDLELELYSLHQAYGASAYYQTLLIVCVNGDAIHQYKVLPDSQAKGPIEFQHDARYPSLSNTSVSSCALSSNGEFLAVGYMNGQIVVYNTEERREVGKLESHKWAVSSLYFSNWSDPNAPHILVSVGEQIVFWSIDIVLNNPRPDTSDVRRSGRFKGKRTSVSSSPIEIRRSGSSRSGLSTPLPSSPMQKISFGTAFDETLQWFSKQGPSNKPHLLSCVKLIGTAQRLIVGSSFNRFLTIDDEGHIYYLRLYRPTATSFNLDVSFPEAGHRLSNGSNHI